MNRIKSDKIICASQIVSGYVYFENDKIVDVTDMELPFEQEYDATGYYVSPGFIDTHTHGGGGYAFEGSAEDVINAANFHLKHGTTSIAPTLATAPFPQIRQGIINIAAAISDSRAKSNIIGSHVEGPYLSPTQTGAQSPDAITAPVAVDYEPLIEQYGHTIARWTYAPERDADQAFCRFLVKHGIVPSVGHSDAIYKDMAEAMDAGCHLVTHLYSCTSTITRDHGFRRLGVIETAYLEDNMYVELIADGRHLPPELIRMIYKIKGSDRILLCTDSMPVAGTETVTGDLNGINYIIEDGVCKLYDRSAFAGSIATDDRLIRVMTKEAGIPLTEAIKMLTEIPAKFMRLNKGTLEAGKDADIIVFDDDIQIRGLFVMGKHYTPEEI